MWLVAVLFSLLLSSPSSAFQWRGFGPLYDSQSWDYSPSWMADTVSGFDRQWWCSDRYGVGEPPWEGNVIKYRQGTGSDSVVLTPSGSG